MDDIRTLLTQPWAEMALGLSLLLLLAVLADLLVRRVMLRIATVLTRRTAWQWDDAFVRHGVLRWLGHVMPALVIYLGIALVPAIPEAVTVVVRNVARASIALCVLLALSAMLSAIEALYRDSQRGRERSIKAPIQLLKIVLFVIGAVLIFATLIDRQPLLLLSGLGAMSAVLMLVFKDTLLGFVAGIQLTSNDMLRVGDWIEMPTAGADGDVIDIALHTVKVQNWDKTITTIPTWRLIDSSFKNWRGMREWGGRRIKRSLVLDSSSVRFLSDEETAALSRFHLLSDYLQAKRDELQRWNRELGDPGKVPVNQRRLTNVGTFRAYASAYLKVHPEINSQMMCMVRQLASGPEGLPLEIYCFTATTAWVDYERIQADIFDHLIAILPEFGLGLYQQPGGGDLRRVLGQARALDAGTMPP